MTRLNQHASIVSTVKADIIQPISTTSSDLTGPQQIQSNRVSNDLLPPPQTKHQIQSRAP